MSHYGVMSGCLCQISRSQVGGGNGYEVMLQVASSKFLLVRWFHEAVFICETQREKRGLRSFPPLLQWLTETIYGGRQAVHNSLPPSRPDHCSVTPGLES